MIHKSENTTELLARLLMFAAGSGILALLWCAWKFACTDGPTLESCPVVVTIFPMMGTPYIIALGLIYIAIFED